MKIRTDFVTNSSSSSFVALLDLTFDNGEKLKLKYSSSRGGGDYDYIKEPKAYSDSSCELTGYELREAERQSALELQKRLNRLMRNVPSKYANAKKIVSGKLKLQELTYGEYFEDAEPKELLSKYCICPMPVVLKEDNVASLFERMRSNQEYAKYTDSALREIAMAMLSDDHESETVIIYKLNADYTMDVSIDTDEGIIETESFDQFDFDDDDEYEDDDEDEDEDDDEYDEDEDDE